MASIFKMRGFFPLRSSGFFPQVLISWKKKQIQKSQVALVIDQSVSSLSQPGWHFNGMGVGVGGSSGAFLCSLMGQIKVLYCFLEVADTKAEAGNYASELNQHSLTHFPPPSATQAYPTSPEGTLPASFYTDRYSGVCLKYLLQGFTTEVLCSHHIPMMILMGSFYKYFLGYMMVQVYNFHICHNSTHTHTLNMSFPQPYSTIPPFQSSNGTQQSKMESLSLERAVPV